MSGSSPAGEGASTDEAGPYDVCGLLQEATACCGTLAWPVANRQAASSRQTSGQPLIEPTRPQIRGRLVYARTPLPPHWHGRTQASSQQQCLRLWKEKGSLTLKQCARDSVCHLVFIGCGQVNGRLAQVVFSVDPDHEMGSVNSAFMVPRVTENVSNMHAMTLKESTSNMHAMKLKVVTLTQFSCA